MKSEYWTVAYRKRSGSKDLMDNLQDAFHVIPNTWRYWHADPHLYTFEGETYLFAEAYDRLKRRGVISCCVLRDDGVSKWKKVLDTGSHVSYPHVFTLNGEIVMIPESYAAQEVSLYRAVRFPDQWEKIQVLDTHIAVDSTVFCYGNTTWLLNHQNDQLVLSHFDGRTLSGERVVSKQGMMTRPAGHLFRHQNKLIRPAQDCRNGYGSALVFYEVQTVSEDCYAEELFYSIHPENISSDYSGVPKGIHTYNMNDAYEVIDLKNYEFDLWFHLLRPFWFVANRVKRLLHR